MTLTHPVPGGEQTARYGPRGVVPGLGDLGFHTGNDWAAEPGTPILAAHTGKILRKWWDEFKGGGGAGGWMVSILGDEGLETRYAHMITGSPLAVNQRVNAGDQIGQVGASGAATGSHLHFEVLRKGRFVDPLPLIRDTPNKPKAQGDDDMAYLITTDKGEILVVDHNQATYWNVHKGIPFELVDLRMTWLKNQGAVREIQGLQPSALLAGYREVGAPAGTVGTVEIDDADLKAIAKAVNDDAAERLKQ